MDKRSLRLTPALAARQMRSDTNRKPDSCKEDDFGLQLYTIPE